MRLQYNLVSLFLRSIISFATKSRRHQEKINSKLIGMKRLLIFLFCSTFIFSCTPDGQPMSQQSLDSLAAQNDPVDTFFVQKNTPISKAQAATVTNVKADTIKKNDSVLPPKNNSTSVSNTSAIVTNPDVYPAFPGGELIMQDYIAKHKIYPLVAFQNEIKGIVDVKFVVETDGSLTNISVIQGLGYGCDESAIDLVRKMPKWIPAKKAGVNVRCNVILPLSFGL